MKYILGLLILFTTNSVFAQKIYTLNDSIPIIQDSVTIKSGPHRGKIQWQMSLDSKNWMNLSGQTNDSLRIKPDIEAVYRAKVVDGECLPTYSDSVRIGFTPPEVLTLIANDVKHNSAVIGGNILSNGGVILSEIGICYSLNSDPTVTNFKIIINSGLEEFIDTIHGLTPNTRYYARAYAINSKGIAYGNTIQFNTLPLTFTVSTYVTASVGGSITGPDSSKLVIPAEALKINGTATISITGNEPKTVPNQNLQIVGTSYSLGFPGDSLNHSVQFSFPLPKIDVPIENYGLFIYDGKSYFPIEYSINDNIVTVIVDNISWGSFDQSLKDGKLLSSLVIVGLVVKQMLPALGEMGLKEVTLVSGKLDFLEPSANKDSKIILLIHGWTGSPRTWETFIPNLISETDFSLFKIWTFGYNSSLSVENNGAKLTQELEKYTNGSKVNIVAHSMGGLVSREMLEYNNGMKYTNKLITLGTPHKGSPLAALRTIIGEFVNKEGNLVENLIYDYTTKGFRDLREGSTFIQKMMNIKSPPIPYYLIAATNNGKYITDFCFTDLNDGIVSVSSALGVPGCIASPLINIPVGPAHTQMTEDTENIYRQVLVYLRGDMPKINTEEVTNITQTSATSGGNITSDGGATVTSRGVCWSTFQDPTLATKIPATGSGTGSFSCTISGLTANTVYYVWAYAINSAGTAYGNKLSFKTSAAESGTVTDIDGNVYHTVTIGSQVWMVENLKTTKLNDGSSIPYVTDGTSWANLNDLGYCWYKNDVNNKDIYGALYNWYAVNTGKLAPIGWHIPSDSEWIALTGSLGGTIVAGGKLKETGTGLWLAPNGGATNESGFTARPGGYRESGLGNFNTPGIRGLWWTSSPAASEAAWAHFLNNENGEDRNNYFQRRYGLSVRCVKDNSPSALVPTINTTIASNITQSTATSGGNITSDGGAVITSRGICWSISQDPTLAAKIPAIGSGTGSFACNISGLTANTTYYVWAYAINSAGTGYGNVVTFKTSATGNLTGTFTDSRDGKTYKWVKIGNQTWMAENLAYLPSVSPVSIGSTVEKHYYVYSYNGNDVTQAKASLNYNTYGVLYNWPAANSSCPVGWHLPTDEEWKELEQFLGMAEVQLNNTGWRGTDQGAQLKSLAKWNGNNSTEFSATPGGARYDGFIYGSGSFEGINEVTSFYTSTIANSTDSWFRSLNSTFEMVNRFSNSKSYGFSVRCIKD